MGFADRADAPPTKSTSGIRNHIDVALEAMPEAEADHARRLLAGPKTDAEVAADFTAEGWPVKWGSVRNWRQTNKVGRFA